MERFEKGSSSSTEDAIDALKRKEAIVARAQELRNSESFEKLPSQVQQKFENYRILTHGGLSEGGK